MKRKMYQRITVILTAILTFSIVCMLSGCASAQEDETTPATQTPANTEEENVTAEPGSVSDESDAADGTVSQEEAIEETAEKTTEETTEAVTYDGIDMESTLPGVDWIETFVGVIEEPKIVVFNDKTNRKIIVENGEVVSFGKTDTIAVYLPDGVRLMSSGGGLSREGKDHEHSFEITKVNMVRLEEEYQALKDITGGAEFYVILDNNGVEERLDCIIALVE